MKDSIKRDDALDIAKGISCVESFETMDLCFSHATVFPHFRFGLE